MNKIAGTIITFCRPEYYQQSLKSIENSYLSDKIDWYIFQDGTKFFPKEAYAYKNVTEKSVLSNIELTNSSSLPIKEHNINKFNYGVNYQINKIVKLFNKGYETLFIFEDDLIISKNYLRLLRQCSIEYPNIVVSFHSVGKVHKNYNLLVRNKAARLWGFYLTKTVWGKISSSWYSFYNESTPRLNREPFYDTVFSQAIRKYTGGKYESEVSRAINIGKEGLSYRNENWNKRNMHLQKEEIDFKEDFNRKGFILGK